VPLAAMALTHDNLSHPAEYDRQPLLGFVSQEARKNSSRTLGSDNESVWSKIEQRPARYDGAFFDTRNKSISCTLMDRWRMPAFGADARKAPSPRAWMGLFFWGPNIG
jgi:hypothetical protein